MKVAFLYHYAILGGCTSQLRNRLALLDTGIEPHFIFLEEHGGSRAFGDYPHVVSNLTRRNLSRYLNQNEFEIAAVLDSPRLHGLLDKCGFQGRIVGEVHTTYEHNLQYLHDRHLVSRIHAFVTPSRYLSDLISSKHLENGHKPIHVVPNCIDVGLFKPIPVESSREKQIVLWLGKLDDHKNWRGFLQMASRLQRNSSKFEFWMVGGETAPDRDVSSLLSTIRMRGLLSQVRWIQRVEYDRMPALYSVVAQSGGCLLITSRGESFCMAALEALCCGCPVVAPSHTALPELLADGKYGLLYDPDDIAAATAQVEKCLTDNTVRSNLTHSALSEIPDKYAGGTVMAQYAQLLNSI